jgi:hypothetical protein
MQKSSLKVFRDEFMDVYESRRELRRMNKRDLFELLSDQRLSRCPIGDRACGFLLYYKGFNFCTSEILGQSCQVERSEKLEDRYEGLMEINGLFPILQRSEAGPSGKEIRNPVFRVYCKDNVTRSMILLGKMIERRTRERGNNLKDLLAKATKDYSNCGADPFTIFLLSS